MSTIIKILLILVSIIARKYISLKLSADRSGHGSLPKAMGARPRTKSEAPRWGAGRVSKDMIFERLVVLNQRYKGEAGKLFLLKLVCGFFNQ